MSPVTRQTVIPYPARKSGVRLSKSIDAKTKFSESPANKSANVTPKKRLDLQSVTPSSALATLSIKSPAVSHGKDSCDDLPCREDEIHTLYEFLLECVSEKKPGSVYISGQPGTGKTATLSHLISLKEISDNCQIVMANCTAVKSAHAIYSQIAASMNLKLHSKTERSVTAAIEKSFIRTSVSQKMILLVLDEIDQLTSKFQTVLYKIFEWPARGDSRIILVGIANAVDLTDRVLPRLRSLVLQPKLLHFKPYTKEQIVKILRYKLSKSEDAVVFAPGSLELISAKVAGQSGDIRRAIDLGRRVLEISRQSYERKPTPQKRLFNDEENENTVRESSPRKTSCPKEEILTRSARKRMLNPSEEGDSDCVTPRKTPRKTIATYVQLEKENAMSPKNSARKLERTPCKPLTFLNENSPVLRKTPRRELAMSEETPNKKPSPRKTLFQIEGSSEKKKKLPVTVESSPRRSPRKALLQKDESSQLMKAVTSSKAITAALEFSPRRSPRKSSLGRTPTKSSPVKPAAINASDVLSVMNQMCPSARRLRTEQSSFPLHQKLLICTLMLVITKGKNRDVNIGKLHEVYGRVCSRRGISAIDLSEFISVCRQVEMAGALEIGKGPGKLAKVTLQWDETEVTHALKDTSLLTAILSDTQVLGKKLFPLRSVSSWDLISMKVSGMKPVENIILYLHTYLQGQGPKIPINEELIRWGWPEDVWFHVDKLSSAHVYLRLHPGQTLDDVPAAVIDEAAQLVKANSITGNKMNDVDVVYTMWSNLKKTDGMEVGQVSFHKEKEVRKTRVAKRSNEVINRLNKTKTEAHPDFRAEREERDRKEREDKKKLQREQKEREKEEQARKQKEAELRSYNTLFTAENMSTNRDNGYDSDDFM